MGRYILIRLLSAVPSVLLLVLFVVILIRLLPGNAVNLMLTEQTKASDTSRQQLEARLGLDKSVPEAYASYVGGMLHGDLGKSVWSRHGVAGEVRLRMGVTLELLGIALFFAVLVGIPIGVISAAAPNSPIDYLLRSLSIFGLSIPNFAVATMVIVLPAFWWRWSPPLIYAPPSAGLWTHISHFFTPAAVLALPLSATLMRITRTTMMEVLRLDYIRTARAKGLRGIVIIQRHALRNALIPVISLLGVQVAYLLSGAVIIESVFALPGMGGSLLEAVHTRDYPTVQGFTVVSGLLVILTNLVVDISYGLIDPRTRVS